MIKPSSPDSFKTTLISLWSCRVSLCPLTLTPSAPRSSTTSLPSYPPSLRVAASRFRRGARTLHRWTQQNQQQQQLVARSWSSSSRSSPSPPTHPGDPGPAWSHSDLVGQSESAPLPSFGLGDHLPLGGEILGASVGGTVGGGDDWAEFLNFPAPDLGVAEPGHADSALLVAITEAPDAGLYNDMTLAGLFGPTAPAVAMDSNDLFSQHAFLDHLRPSQAQDFPTVTTTSSSSIASTTPNTLPTAAAAPPTPLLQDSPTSTSSKRKATDSAEEQADTALKRQRNTLAARKYRQKRLDRVADLEKALADMQGERDALRLQLARREAEADALRDMLAKK